MRTPLVLAAAFGLVLGLSSFAAAEQPRPAAPVVPAAANPEEAAVHAALEGFVAAFQAGKGEQVAASFTEQAEFIDDEGNGVRGRAAIGKLFEEYFAKNKDAKIQLTLGGVRVVAPGVALEDGESTVTVPSKNAQTTRRYGMVLVKQGSPIKWLIASVREFPQDDEPEPAAERLAALGWMVGDWVDEGGDAIVATTIRWSDDKTCLLRDFTVKVKGQEVQKGSQRIGVDPRTGELKGWIFDSDGGQGETVWVKANDGWLVKATGATSDGKPTSATYQVSQAGKDKILWKARDRVTGDIVEEDLEVTLVRRPPVAGGVKPAAK